MTLSIDGVGAKKTDETLLKRQEKLLEGTSQRDEVAYASLPGLLNGSHNPSQGTQAGFNA